MTPSAVDVVLVAGYVALTGFSLASGFRNRQGERSDVCLVCETETLAGQTYCHGCRADLGGPTDAW
ncbi:hypothetical protein SAMN04487948_10784 [Halogranum amylolyticum]|uniref:Uncharacterized protein n=1 Tax=Halogranum amylolyticum TaxID=660520 RepID=A0A1H8TIV0_9EURY|nr:hypothetical protein [Halogranum amylolyticum]SEO90745.1 hypothetical protein SAMN04487948_10784 [Halogranum amylolyticum]